ncbi:NAD(P)-dependent dehydrogenase (short-subunit alcohol dehydrogenase family) [Kibdelosporangium banguiense]|uniref:NAD(P)-dependent dehydrogenase (Short-subunit alcohol dehydrogenase family) n=1 Tax=Kibdelosporangium banguiense TaxID=1365924 RepID=A0ABS4U222_9PSEU|nr:SDR family oxidoreductase [Kibdelosporangium banguiense]MBP2330670.1 NAD(P)-dependent dehydrogenase (short-subunit alcohol dehydrogenase family) [Kibdelosporangium banguiense]
MSTILITGGASGLGAAVASAVMADGGQAVVLDKASPAAPVTGFLPVDLSDSAAAEAATVEAAQRYGDLDGVVTAAGIDSCGALTDVSTSDWERVVQVNLFGTVAVIRAALPCLQRSRGRVVTVASTLGLRALPEATAYCASKFGIVGFTRALAAETAGRVGVTLLVPGGMQTGFFDGRDEKYRPADMSQLNPPRNVAAMILFALSQPVGCEIRELVTCASQEPSWP